MESDHFSALLYIHVYTSKYIRLIFYYYTGQLGVVLNNSEAQVERVKKTIENFTTNLANAWNRPNCGYFDETTNKGGPDPNPDGGVRNELFRSGFEILRELREGPGWVWGK